MFGDLFAPSLVYDGVFEVLQWLLFLSAVPPVQLLGVGSG